MEPQKENWEERFEKIFTTNKNANIVLAVVDFDWVEKHIVSKRTFNKMKEIIAQERLLAQKEFGERLLKKKTEVWDGKLTTPIVPAEDIEAEIKDLGV